MQKSAAVHAVPVTHSEIDERSVTRRPRVLMATNIVPHYRVSFYEKLCHGIDASWLVLRGESGGNLVGEKDYDGPIAAPLQRLVNKEWRIGPYTIRWQQGLWRALSEFDPDVVILSGMPGSLSTWACLLWARSRGRASIVWACAWEPHGAGSLALRAKQLVLKAFYSLPNRCLLYSSRAQRYLDHLGVPENKLRVCFNGLDIDPWRNSETFVQRQARAWRAAQAPDGTTVFLYVGGMVAEKRLDLLLHALWQLQSQGHACALWLVGDGPVREVTQALAQKLQVQNVTFFGRIVEGVEKFFAAADFFVLPGVGGLAFNQAMFWGAPCIGSEADGTEEDLIIDNVTGKRFLSGDVASLTAAMLQCMALSEGERAAMSARARQIILERSNVTQMVRVFHETVAELIDANGSAAAQRA